MNSDFCISAVTLTGCIQVHDYPQVKIPTEGCSCIFFWEVLSEKLLVFFILDLEAIFENAKGAF